MPCFAIALLSLLAPLSHSGVPVRVVPGASGLLDPPAAGTRLKRNMDFWLRIYTQYSTHQGLVHDAKDVDRVYEILEFQNLSQREKDRLIRASRRRWRETLLSLHKKQGKTTKLTEEEVRVFRMFASDPSPQRFLNAATLRRVRFQLGQKDRFMEGLRDSGHFLPHMEEIFRREGLPSELTRLPFVESSFNLRAKSKVGASGIWQFMQSTAKLYRLRINDAVDERNDPIRATEAAARLLRANHSSLGSWPLAVTAYNHGTQGVSKAVRKAGTEDLGELIEAYQSRRFGFASTNFYTELLAAVEAERNSTRYFGPVSRAAATRFYEVELPHYIALKDLRHFLSLDEGSLRELNPALTERVFQGKLRIPAGYRLRLPGDGRSDGERSARIFLAGYSQIPGMFKFRAQERTGARRGLASNESSRRMTSGKRRVTGARRGR